VCPAGLELSRGAGRLIGTVLETAGGLYRVHIEGEALECSVRGRLKKEGGSRVAVGDRVEVERLPDGSGRIVDVHPRASKLSRHAPSRRREQIIAANVDQVAAVVAVARPEPDRRMLDRLLAVAELNDLGAFLVINKVDLIPDQALPEELETYRSLGYPMLLTSASDGTGLDELWARLEDKVTVFSGPSGVGKSSLLNALMPGLELRVGEVGERSGRGRHTTVGALLIPLPRGGYLADTPGIQHFEPGFLDPRELETAFREMAPLKGTCRFADCRHRAEPGCAVIAAVADGRIDGRRYEGYLELLEIADQASERVIRGNSSA
jgi:ribosome biogenesis GTPase